MYQILLVFLGAGLGGTFRYWVSNWCYWLMGKSFPYGTLVVNVSGCFLIGLFFPLLLTHLHKLESFLRYFLIIGLLGGYTTFSAFSIDTVTLFENDLWLKGAINILL